MGDWEYFSCLVPIKEVANRVNYAEELHPQTGNLSDLLQRSLKEGRGKEIAKYLAHENERLFNSLVVAVYEGDPEWHEFGSLKAQLPSIRVEDISSWAREGVGFLSFNGKERLFAIDGQHRLAGIKLHSKSEKCNDADEISVLFVAHRNSRKGLQRTRRLFTTLNKRAKAVSKGEVISLDEDDAMAITVRRLVEDCKYFSGERVAYNSTNNIPPTNRKCLTTIGNLYDVLKILFTQVESPYKSKSKDLLYYRPDEKKLNDLYEFAVEFFDKMAADFKPLDEFFKQAKFEKVTSRCRGEFGGNLLFRPIGLTTIMRVIAELSEKQSLQVAIKMASKLPLNLAEKPLLHLMWDEGRQAMKKPQNDAIARRVFLYILGINVDEKKLANDYATAVGQPGNGDLLYDDLKKFTHHK
jgi:DNA sulfur modification protein DndB